MRQQVSVYKNTPIYFDADTEKFTCLPEGCTKERSSDAMAAMRGEIDAAERRRNQPKRTKTNHFVQWYDRKNETVYSGYFVGCRAGRGSSDKGYYFKRSRGDTYIHNGYGSDTMLIVPTTTGPAQIGEVKAARTAWLQAKAEYDRLINEYFVEVKLPYIGYGSETADLNGYDEEFLKDLKTAQGQEAE
jgi:hypothetical protein